MDFYRYKAIDSSGRMQTGRTDAGNTADLEMRLQKMGLDLVHCKQVKARKKSFGGGIKRRELIMFCLHLQQMARAGVPILQGLKDLSDSTDNPRLKTVVSAMIESIEGGKTLSQSMLDFPTVFSGVFANLVAAGEQSGQLGMVLGKLADSLKFQDEQAAMSKKLIMYPSFVGLVVIGVLFFLMTYLVPELITFVQTIGHDLPGHTKLLIASSALFVDYGWALLLFVLLSVAGLIIAINLSPGLALAVDQVKLRLPVLGPVLKKIILARLASFFAMMYASGITIIDCIRTGEQIAGNRAIAVALRDVRQHIADGNNLGDSFAAAGLFPPLVIRMIKVGESTGALEQALENVCYFYNRDIRESISRLQGLIEPVMTTVLGIIIGWVMLSILGPVYDIISNIKI
ncbi:MAG: type II secretion system F family protein [Gammaproteobacteria bacterium]